MRFKIDNKIGMLASVTQAISEAHGIVGAIDLVQPEDGVLVRDISIYTYDFIGNSFFRNSKIVCIISCPAINYHKVPKLFFNNSFLYSSSLFFKRFTLL